MQKKQQHRNASEISVFTGKYSFLAGMRLWFDCEDKKRNKTRLLGYCVTNTGDFSSWHLICVRIVLWFHREGSMLPSKLPWAARFWWVSHCPCRFTSYFPTVCKGETALTNKLALHWLHRRINTFPVLVVTASFLCRGRTFLPFIILHVSFIHSMVVSPSRAACSCSGVGSLVHLTSAGVSSVDWILTVRTQAKHTHVLCSSLAALTLTDKNVCAACRSECGTSPRSGHLVTPRHSSFLIHYHNIASNEIDFYFFML